MNCLLCRKNVSYTVSDILRSGEKRKVYFCKRCSLGMLDDRRSELGLKNFYQNDYRKLFKPRIRSNTSPRELFDIYYRFQAGRIKLVKRFLNKRARLLEIGCSSGMFLFAVKKYVREVVGIDYDSRSARFAEKKCSCRVFDTDIDWTELKKSSFDIICLFQALEHIKDPLALLMKIREYLKPNGVIYIEVPNLRDALIYAYNLPNHYKFYFHSAHLWYFTAESLLSLMKMSGFSGRIYFSQDYNFLNHTHWISSGSPQEDCLSGLSAPQLPLRGSLDSLRKGELTKFIQKADLEYKRLLEKLGITSNISFIGRRGLRK